MDTANKKRIPIEVRGEYILGSGVSIGARGSYDSVILRVKFDDSWAGLNKYATWSNALGEMVDQTIITSLNGVDGLEGTYDIPVTAPVTKHAGTVKLSFTGYALSRGGDDRTVESLINTASGSFRVLESNADPLDGAGTASLIAAQLLKQLDDHMTEVNGKVEAIEDRASDVEERMTVVEGKMEAVEGAEEERIAAEKARDGNEVIRQSNELVRGENEVFRQAQEDIRKANEDERISKETSRERRFSEMESLVGDLPEALEAILALQESLIGGDEQ